VSFGNLDEVHDFSYHVFFWNRKSYVRILVPDISNKRWVLFLSFSTENYNINMTEIVSEIELKIRFSGLAEDFSVSCSQLIK
jgi:hypothetical protein